MCVCVCATREKGGKKGARCEKKNKYTFDYSNEREECVGVCGFAWIITIRKYVYIIFNI